MKRGSPLMKKFGQECILIVDDDPVALALYEAILTDAGMGRVIVSDNGRDVADRLQDNNVSLMLLDIVMPGIGGLEVLEQTVETHPDLPIIMISGDDDLQTVVRCMKTGAYDYLNKPVDRTRLVTAAHRALEWRELNTELTALGDRVLNRDSLENPEAFSSIVTSSDSMLSVFQYVEAVAPTNRPVLITGDSGTGKELLARAIHVASGRSGPLVTVNAAGLDDALFSDTLFGHRKGAFTDASTDRSGLVEKAAGGTLFLDEIGDLAPASQVKLLRLLQEREYLPLGSDEPRITDARVVAATCSDLSLRIEEGLFRRDLFFRLKAHQVHLPPLKERREDLMLLTEAFLQEAAAELGKSVPRISGELAAMLNLYEFPGNVRELHSLVYDALSRTSGTVLNLTPFRDLVGSGGELPVVGDTTSTCGELDYEGLVNIFGHFPTIKEVTDVVFDAALAKADSNQSLASRLLGVNQATVSRRLAKDDN